MNKVIQILTKNPLCFFLENGQNDSSTKNLNKLYFLLFYLGFLSRTFTIHKTPGEGEGYLFNFSLPLAPASQTLRH